MRRRGARHLAPLLWTVAGLAAACGVDPAPTELQSLLPFFWVHFAAAPDTQVAEAVRNLDAALKGVTADAPLEGSLGRLTKAQLAVVGLEAVNDPSLAAGMMIATELPCTLAQVEKIVVALEQDALYPDHYDTYSRKYATEAAPYLARKTPQLAWDTSLAATTLGFKYTENLKGGVRFVADLGKVDSPFGAILVARTWLPKPAVFEDDGKTFPQDYQIEIYYERSAGRVVHVFGAWRQMDFSGVTTDGDFLVGKMTGGFLDWDKETAALCKAGKP